MQNYKTRKWGQRLLPPVLIIRIMKLTAVFLLAISVNVSANGYSQNVTLNFSRTSLEKIFNEIRKQTGYVFFYKTDLLKDLPKVKVKVNNASISEAMDASLINLPVTYAITEKTIVIRPKEIIEKKSVVEYSPPADLKISGRITTDAGKPLVGASVQLKGTEIGTVTNATGDFELLIPSGGGILVISYVGYDSQEIAVNRETNVNIVLREKESKVDEVVIVGYGSVRRSDLTGAVSSDVITAGILIWTMVVQIILSIITFVLMVD